MKKKSGNSFKLKKGRFRLDIRKTFLTVRDETLEEVDQSCGCLCPESVQDQVGRSSEQSDLVKDVPAHSMIL